jgi:2-amino-4-hydroxy-6-hydroxymethyldihydropteridine diphosphokinase
METVWIGIGSNLGDREVALSRAIEFMSNEGLLIESRSLIYQTEPWGMEGVPDFLNMVVRAKTRFSAVKLAKALQRIESSMGRVRNAAGYESREIDLDILFFGNQTVDLPELQIPHSRLHRRLFVMIPMVEIDPGWIHPGLKKSMTELLTECIDSSECRLYHNTAI